MLRIVLLTFFLLTVISSAADQDVIVDVQDAMITAGGSGFVDVLISSTGMDTLSCFL